MDCGAVLTTGVALDKFKQVQMNFPILRHCYLADLLSQEGQASEKNLPGASFFLEKKKKKSGGGVCVLYVRFRVSGHVCHSDCRDSTVAGVSPSILFKTGSLVYHFIVS